MVLKLISSIFIMTTFSFFIFAEESSVGLAQVKNALKSINFQEQHLNSSIATPDLVDQERDALSSRRLKIDSPNDVETVLSSIQVSQHLVSLNITF